MFSRGITLVELLATVSILLIVLLAFRPGRAGSEELPMVMSAVRVVYAEAIAKSRNEPERSIGVESRLANGQLQLRVLDLNSGETLESRSLKLNTIRPINNGPGLYRVTRNGQLQAQDADSCEAFAFRGPQGQVLFHNPFTLAQQQVALEDFSCARVFTAPASNAPRLPQGQNTGSPTSPEPPSPPPVASPPPGGDTGNAPAENAQGRLYISARGLPAGAPRPQASLSAGGAALRTETLPANLSLNEGEYSIEALSVRHGGCQYSGTPTPPSVRIAGGRLAAVEVQYRLQSALLSQVTLSSSNISQEGATLEARFQTRGVDRVESSLTPGDTGSAPAPISVADGEHTLRFSVGRNPDPWKRQYTLLLTGIGCAEAGRVQTQVQFGQEAGTGRLSLNLSGLPNGVRTNARLSGTWKGQACPSKTVEVQNGSNTVEVFAGCNYNVDLDNYTSAGMPDPREWRVSSQSVQVLSGQSASVTVSYNRHHAEISLSIPSIPSELRGRWADVMLGGKKLETVQLVDGLPARFYTVSPLGNASLSLVLHNPHPGYASQFSPGSLNVTAGSSHSATLSFTELRGTVRVNFSHWFVPYGGQGNYRVGLYADGGCNTPAAGQSPSSIFTNQSSHAWQTSVRAGSYYLGIGRIGWEGQTVGTPRCEPVTINANQTTTVNHSYGDNMGLLRLSIDRFNAQITNNGTSMWLGPGWLEDAGFATYNRLLPANTSVNIYAGIRDGWWYPFNTHPAPSPATSSGLNQTLGVTARGVIQFTVNYARYYEACTQMIETPDHEICIQWSKLKAEE